MKKAVIAAAAALLALTGCASDMRSGSASAASTGTAAGTETVTQQTTETTAASAEVTSATETEAAAETTAEPESSQPENAPIDVTAGINSAAAAVQSLDTGYAPVCFGSAKPSEEALQALTDSFQSLASISGRASFILYDVNTASGVSCGANTASCTQSVIKAAFIGSLIESRPELLYSEYEAIHDTLVYSSNYDYEYLRSTYGVSALSQWCDEAGVSGNIAYQAYPVMPPLDMLRLFGRLYKFLSVSETGQQLSSLYRYSIGSAGNAIYGGSCVVWSKAGWECGAADDEVSYDPTAPIPAYLTDGDPYNDECAANDAGIIFSESGPYIYVVFISIPFGVFEENNPDNPLPDITRRLHDAAASMGRDTAF